MAISRPLIRVPPSHIRRRRTDRSSLVIPIACLFLVSIAFTLNIFLGVQYEKNSVAATTTVPKTTRTLFGLTRSNLIRERGIYNPTELEKNSAHFRNVFRGSLGNIATRATIENDIDMELESGNSLDDNTEEPSKGKRKKKKGKGERKVASSRAGFDNDNSQPNFLSIQCQNISHTYGIQDVLENVNFAVNTGDRLGLVGANGGGKTTLAKIIAGDIEPSGGKMVYQPKDIRLAFLRQEFWDDLDPERSLKEEIMSGMANEMAILKGIEECEKEMEKKDVQEDPEKMQAALDRLMDLNERAEQSKVYQMESRVDTVRNMMGFTEEDREMKVSSFSGGWKMRIGLAKILLKDPNLLILDEPTNHLDLASVNWLESFLIEQKIPMVIVSHDREFLDKVCTSIVDVEPLAPGEPSTAAKYEGNYSKFLRQKSQRIDEMQKKWDLQQKKVKEIKQWMQKFRNNEAMSTQYQQRERKLRDMQDPNSKDYVQRPMRMQKFFFRFPEPPRCPPGQILGVSKMSHGYGESQLFDEAEFSASTGNKIALIGPNGMGKSTLFRLMQGKEEANDGTVEWYGPSVKVAYYDQNQADALELDRTVLQTVGDAAPFDTTTEELRGLLGQFKFTGDTVFKKIKVLSGGEKARVALAQMMLTPANVLVLDEPTNHLDIPAKEILEEALQNYPGTIILSSHDRFFISQVANTIVNLKDKKLFRYDVDYKTFLEEHPELREQVEARYVAGVGPIKGVADKLAQIKEKQGKKKFVSKGPSGKKSKGIKNAKRYGEL
eukprot:jgi/Bigna1/68572/fgenesh1_pg.6_\